MAPIRRYLRITKYSALEVRIYLDNPALASSWLLRARDPILPRVIEAVRPLVLPKLKEENTRQRGKAKGKKKGVKDVIVEDDFEVSIFLTPTSTTHSLVTKQRHFRDKGEPGMRSNSDKLTGDGATSAEAIDVEDGGTDGNMPILAREESDERIVALEDIPEAESDDVDEEDAMQGLVRRSKRMRRRTADEDDGADGLFVDEEDEDEEPQPKRIKETSLIGEDRNDDKKKMVMDTSYDGFSMYGRVLCLIIKQRGYGKARSGNTVGGQAMMEDWITSTQMPIIDDDAP